MNEWFASLDLTPWISTVAIYLFGIATGWLIWGGRSTAVANGDTNGHLNGDDAIVEASVEAEAEKKEPPVEDKTAAKALFSSKSKNGDAKDNNNGDDPAPNSMKLGALESELRKAHEMLAETSEDREDYAEHLSDLEAALKRANGRLKLIMKAVKKAKPER